MTVEEPIGQYASMHGKSSIEKIVQQVRDTIDEHDMRELENVATDKMVRCVRNREKDSSQPKRPPRESTSSPSPVIPPSHSSSSSSLYEPDDSQGERHEDEQDN